MNAREEENSGGKVVNGAPCGIMSFAGCQTRSKHCEQVTVESKALSPSGGMKLGRRSGARAKHKFIHDPGPLNTSSGLSIWIQVRP